MKTLKRFIGCQRSGIPHIRRWNEARLLAFCALSVVWLGILPVALAQPANDNCADRIAITGTSASVTGSNVGATRESGEPNHAGSSGGASVWWSWVAPVATTVRLDTVGSTFNSILAVYTGTGVSNLTRAASGVVFYTNGLYTTQVGFVPTAGIEYLIAVDGVSGSTGSIVVNLVTEVPLILAQPQPQGVPRGSNATFSVTAAGGAPLSYQWKKSGTSILNATNTTLTLTNVQLSSATYYSVTVTNSLGSVSSPTVVLSLPVSEPYLFTTIAGKAGSVGSIDGTGNAAQFNGPAAVAVDGAGNLYVADYYSHLIRKVAPFGTNWVVTTLAGSAGSAGLVDGTNTDARFNGPNGVALDGDGNLYVADRGNKAVRKIVASGTNWVVSTIATGFSALGGCAVDGAGSIFVADQLRQVIQKISLVGTNWVITPVAGKADNSGTADGTNTAARFSMPDRVAVDGPGNLYVADLESHIIRKLKLFGTNWVVSTIAGTAHQSAAVDGTNSTARFYWPKGVAVDGAGNVYVGDYGNDTVRKITPAGVTTTLAGLGQTTGNADGAGGAARFNEPNGLAVDSHGIVYVPDSFNQTIRMGRPVIQMQPLPSSLSGQTQTQGFRCSISLASGLNYRIQASPDLSIWVDLTNLTPAGLAFSFWDSGATNFPQRFYRVLGP